MAANKEDYIMANEENMTRRFALSWNWNHGLRHYSRRLEWIEYSHRNLLPAGAALSWPTAIWNQAGWAEWGYRVESLIEVLNAFLWRQTKRCLLCAWSNVHWQQCSTGCSFGLPASKSLGNPPIIVVAVSRAPLLYRFFLSGARLRWCSAQTACTWRSRAGIYTISSLISCWSTRQRRIGLSFNCWEQGRTATFFNGFGLLPNGASVLHCRTGALLGPFPKMRKYLSDKEETKGECQLALTFSAHITCIFIYKYF